MLKLPEKSPIVNGDIDLSEYAKKSDVDAIDASLDNKAEKAEVKRCRMCKHWGAVTYTGKPVTPNHILGANRCCIYFPSKTGTYYKCHRPYQLACEHFEEKEIKL